MIDNKIERDKFYDEAFINYEGSIEAKNASIRICEAFGIKGISDPAWIANTIDREREKIK